MKNKHKQIADTKYFTVLALTAVLLFTVGAEFADAAAGVNSISDDFEYTASASGVHLPVGKLWSTSSSHTGWASGVTAYTTTDPDLASNKVLRIDCPIGLSGIYASDAYPEMGNSRNIQVDMRGSSEIWSGAVEYHGIHIGDAENFANAYRLHYADNGDGNGGVFEFVKLVNGAWVYSQSSINDSAAALKGTDWYTINVCINNSEISWSVSERNGKKIWSGNYQDSSALDIGNSSIELFSFNNAKPCGAYFDNFSMRKNMPYIDIGEPDNVMYMDAAYNKIKQTDDGYMIDMGDEYAIRRISFEGASSSNEVTVCASNSEDFSDPFMLFRTDSALADVLNTKTNDKFRYVQLHCTSEPSDRIINNIRVLTDIDAEDTINLFIRDKIKLYPRISGNFINAGLEWKQSNYNCTTIDDGVVAGITDGDTVITASCDSGNISIKLHVTGEINMHIADNTVNEYLEEKRPVLDSLKYALQSDSITEMLKALKNGDSADISEIHDLDYSKIESLSEEDLTSLAGAVLTYDLFPDENYSIDDVYNLINVTNQEIALIALQNSEDITEFDILLNEYNIYFLLDLNNKYFQNNKEKNLIDLKNRTYKNCSEFAKVFHSTYVLNAVLEEVAYRAVGITLEENADVIGYDTEKYNKISDKNKFYQYIMNHKSLITSMEALKKTIDSYKEAVKPTVPSGNDGKGGSSQKGSSGVAVSRVNNNAVAEEKPKPLYIDIDSSSEGYESIAALSLLSVINGYDDGSFRPANTITRSEYIKMLVIAFQLSCSVNAENTFKDITENDWYYRSMVCAKENGIVLGDENGCCNPEAWITRQEAAVMVERILQKIGTLKNNYDTVTIYDDAGSIADWAYPAVIKLTGAGIIAENKNNKFAPLNDMTRVESAQLIYNALSVIGQKGLKL